MINPLQQIRQVDSIARAIANRLALMHTHGRATLRAQSGETISHREARKSAKHTRFSVNFSDGTGIPLSPDDMEELFLCARAALLVRMMEAPETPLSVAWIDAARAARRSLYQITRERIYCTRKLESPDDFARAREHAAWKVSIAGQRELDAETAPRDPVAIAADFIGDGESPRAVILRAYWRARGVLRAYWTARPAYPRKAYDFARDRATLRREARAMLAGSVRLEEIVARNGSPEGNLAKRRREFAARMQAGRALLATRKEAPPRRIALMSVRPEPRPEPINTGETLLPGSFVERWNRRLQTSTLPTVARILARERASRASLESLAAHFARARA